jgi:hypothetical protein
MNLTVNPDVEVFVIIVFGALIAVLLVLGVVRMKRRNTTGEQA